MGLVGLVSDVGEVGVMGTWGCGQGRGPEMSCVVVWIAGGGGWMIDDDGSKTLRLWHLSDTVSKRMSGCRLRYTSTKAGAVVHRLRSPYLPPGLRTCCSCCTSHLPPPQPP